MGRAKEWMMEQEARGYSAADGDICSECVVDPFLAQWVDDNATATTCRFCGRDDDEPIAASFDDFVGMVVGGIGFDWNHPDNEGIMYVGAEGGYQAAVSNIAKPIARDGGEHIEYVPTQIVTEYFRRVFQRSVETRLDGLIYRSSRLPGGKAFVLFCDNAQCVDLGAKEVAWDKPLLRLEKVVHVPCPVSPGSS